MFYEPESIGWQRATRRAIARGVTAQLVASSSDQVSSLERYTTSSHSHPDTRHSVVLVWTCDGLSSVCCDCEGSQSGRICQHMAAAVNVAYEFTAPEALVESTPEPVATFTAAAGWLSRRMAGEA